MAWEDRTPAEKCRALREAEEYAGTDDDETYVTTTSKGSRLTVKGINSAKVVGKDGQIVRQRDGVVISDDRPEHSSQNPSGR